MAFCGKCGASVGKGKFCSYCGALIENPIKKNKATRFYGRPKKRYLLMGIVLIVLGLIVGENWGEKTKKTQWYWYTVYSKELNAIGWLCVAVIFIGAIICAAWLISFIIKKTSIPCPQCGELLIQHQKSCPHCKAKLEWGE